MVDARVRVAISMRREDYEHLKEWAADDQVTVASLLRRAIATRRYLDERVRAGATVLIEVGGVQREVVFR